MSDVGAKPKQPILRVTLGCLGVVVLLLFVLIVIGMCSMPPASETQPQRVERAAGTTEPANTGSAAPSAPPRRPDGIATQAEFSQLFHEIDRYQQRCSEAVTAASSAMQSGDQYAAYDAAKRGDDVCSQAYLDIRALRSPSSSRGEARSALNKMIEDCASTATTGAIAMDRATKVLNGDSRPSAVSEVREAIGWIQGASRTCLVQVVVAAQANQVDVPEA